MHYVACCLVSTFAIVSPADSQAPVRHVGFRSCAFRLLTPVYKRAIVHRKLELARDGRCPDLFAFVQRFGFDALNPNGAGAGMALCASTLLYRLLLGEE